MNDKRQQEKLLMTGRATMRSSLQGLKEMNYGEGGKSSFSQTNINEFFIIVFNFAPILIKK